MASDKKRRKLVLLVTSPDGVLMTYDRKLTFCRKNPGFNYNSLSRLKLPGYYHGYHFQWSVIQRGDEFDAIMLRKYQKELLRL